MSIYRGVVVAVVLAAIAIGAILIHRAQACIGGFHIRYTSPISPIVLSQSRRVESHECSLLVDELIDLELAALRLKLTTDELRSRLTVEALSPAGLQFECRIAYRGKDESETNDVLNQLLELLVESTLRSARQNKARTIAFVKNYLAEIVERRGASRPLAERSLEADPNWSIGSDVENWTAGELASVIERMNAALSTEHEEPTEASCVKYDKQRHKSPSQQLLELPANMRRVETGRGYSVA